MAPSKVDKKLLTMDSPWIYVVDVVVVFITKKKKKRTGKSRQPLNTYSINPSWPSNPLEWSSSNSTMPATILVLTNSGQRQFTLTEILSAQEVMLLLKPTTPCLEAQYAGPKLIGTNPANEIYNSDEVIWPLAEGAQLHLPPNDATLMMVPPLPPFSGDMYSSPKYVPSMTATYWTNDCHISHACSMHLVPNNLSPIYWLDCIFGSRRIH